jgi:hypothetical protein
MDHSEYANTQAYLQGLYDAANRSRLARDCGAGRPDAPFGLLARLRRSGLIFHFGGPGRPRDQFEDDFLTLSLHIG